MSKAAVTLAFALLLLLPAAGRGQAVGDPEVGSGEVAAEGPARPSVWGVVGAHLFADGTKAAPNGLLYDPLFSLDLDLNLWLCPSQGLYLFTDPRFWAERAEHGVGHGQSDFSKRQLDLAVGAAWNYAGPWEARVFAYALNNLNRGLSPTTPSGFKDGVGLENRYYLTERYAQLGRAGYDILRAPFVSVGYFPTKELIGTDGAAFHPGPFARAYLTYDLRGEWVPVFAYLFADVELIGTRSFTPKLLNYDLGVAVRPFARAPRLELRLGAESAADLQLHDVQTLWYGSVRVTF